MRNGNNGISAKRESLALYLSWGSNLVLADEIQGVEVAIGRQQIRVPRT